MKAFLNKFKKILIPLLLVYVYLALLLIPKVNYTLTTEGGLTNVNETFIFEDDLSFQDNFSTIFVYTYYRVTPFQRWMLDKSTRYDISPKSEIQQTLSNKDRNMRGEISKLSGHEQSLIAAYTYAIKTNEEENLGLNISIDYHFESLMVYYASNFLKIGDHIVGINGDSLNDAENYEDAVLRIKETAKPYTLNIKRGSEGLDIVIDDSFSISLYPKYNIISTTPKVNHIPPKSNVGGPSGGLMQTLSLYSSLLQIDLGNISISGTGTMELGSDFKVGRIGGIVQKFYTAKSKKIDYLFVPFDYKNEPNENNTHFSLNEYKELQKLERSFKGVFYVKDFEEAVEVFNEEIISKIK